MADESSGEKKEKEPKRGLGRRMVDAYTRWASRWGPRILILVLLVIAVAAIFFDRMFIFIRPGDQGVLWHRFTGTDIRHHYTEGLTIIFPWDHMYIYDVRYQQVADSFTVLSRDGLSIKAEVSIRYRPQIERLALLQVAVGPDYVERIVKPEVRAKLRYLMGQYLPEEIYASQGLLVRRALEDAAPELAERYVTLDDLLIKSITLPQKLQDAIDAKLEQQQAYLAYEFRLKRETQEKARKKIEAEGIQQFENIIGANGSSFDKYLTYLGIQATLALAQSNNAKVVIIGGNKGLPLILNMPESDVAAAAKAARQKLEKTSPATNEQSVGELLPEVSSQAVEPTKSGK